MDFPQISESFIEQLEELLSLGENISAIYSMQNAKAPGSGGRAGFSYGQYALRYGLPYLRLSLQIKLVLLKKCLS